MDQLNTKIRSSRDDNYTQAQVVGVTGYNETLDRMKIAHVTDANELKVSMTSGIAGDATAANQVLEIAELTQIATNTERLAPQLNRTEAIPVQIMVGRWSKL